MESEYFLRAADLTVNRDQIVDVWALGLEGLIDKVAEAKFRHYYVSNSAGAGACMLLYEKGSNAAIGAQGLIPRNFYLGQQRIAAATMADFVVAPEHRFLGPALMLMKSCIDMSRGRFEFVYGTPNDKSIAILRRAGIRPFGTLTRYTKLIRSSSYLGARMPRWLAFPAAAVADAAIACVDRVRDWHFGGRFRWDEHSTLGTPFERIWEGRQADLLTGERSAAALGWRYAAYDPQYPWQFSVASDRSGTPVGYVIWRQVSGIAMVSDFFSSNIESSVRALLQSFVVHMRQFAVQKVSLEFHGGEKICASLKACGFESREQSRIVVVDHATGKTDAPIASPGQVFMTGFDRDHDI